MANMKIATLQNPQQIIFSDAPMPQRRAGDVLIKVKRFGICGSDLHAYYGQHPFMSCPIVLGHEFSGVVEDVGAGVKDFSPGDAVTVMPQLYCGTCPQCASGRYNICRSLKVIGCQTQGGAAEYIAVDAGLVKKLPPGMTFEQGAMIEPAAVGVHAAKRAGVQDKNVVVLGAGTIGNLCAQAAVAQGAKTVIITDLSDYRLKVARDCGIPHAVNTKERDLGAAIDVICGDWGADVFFECVGVGATINQAIELSQKGRDIVVLGVFGKRPETNMGLVQDKELRLIGSLMYTYEDYDDVLRLVPGGKIKLEPLMSAAYPFENFALAFRDIEKDAEKMMKVIIEVEK